MKYLIKRNDGKKDDITSQVFSSYDQAYDLLEEIYGDICCSDADYEERPYYEIFELNEEWVCYNFIFELIKSFIGCLLRLLNLGKRTAKSKNALIGKEESANVAEIEDYFVYMLPYWKILARN